MHILYILYDLQAKRYYDFMKIQIRIARADTTYGGIRMYNCNNVRRYCFRIRRPCGVYAKRFERFCRT